MKINRSEAIKERLILLNQYMQDEMAMSKPSQTYIDDLKNSIENCEIQLRFAHADYSYTMINGA